MDADTRKVEAISALVSAIESRRRGVLQSEGNTDALWPIEGRLLNACRANAADAWPSERVKDLELYLSHIGPLGYLKLAAVQILRGSPEVRQLINAGRSGKETLSR